MELQGRNLTRQMTGDNVLMPEVELLLLGYQNPFALPGPGPVLPSRASTIDAFDAATASSASR